MSGEWRRVWNDPTEMLGSCGPREKRRSTYNHGLHAPSPEPLSAAVTRGSVNKYYPRWIIEEKNYSQFLNFLAPKTFSLKKKNPS